VLNGKKRYIVSAGVADRYMVYARTGDDPEDRRKYRHLTAFIVEKGMPGFSVEKINEVIGFENIQNGVLDFKDVRVPVSNMLGEEGEGWSVMTAGLNFERTLICAQTAGWMEELLEKHGALLPAPGPVRKTHPQFCEQPVQSGRPGESIEDRQAPDLLHGLFVGSGLGYYPWNPIWPRFITPKASWRPAWMPYR
jgi:hypothetical protein